MLITGTNISKEALEGIPIITKYSYIQKEQAMNKSVEKRQEDIKEIINNPQQGILKLEAKVKALYKCRNTTQLIKGLSELHYLSERTIERDLS